jgi:hypothetical protein
MHPPAFRTDQKLSDWPECHLELQCATCSGRSAIYPMKLFIKLHGNAKFSDLLQKLLCKQCGNRPSAVYLCASPQRQGGHGGPRPDWAIQLVP